MIRITTSCGIREFSGIRGYNDPYRFIEEIRKTEHLTDEGRPAFIWFSDTSDNLNGFRIQKYIENHKLGRIWCSHSRLNRNSGNHIIMWAWEPDHKAVIACVRLKGEKSGSYQLIALTVYKLRKRMLRWLSQFIPKLPTLSIPVEAPRDTFSGTETVIL